MIDHVDWIIVVNHSAGFHRSRSLVKRLTAKLKERGQSWSLIDHEERGFSSSLIEDELIKSPPLQGVIVVGGDGTVHHAANALLTVDPTIPLALIPTGSGNDFARQCGLLGREVEELLDLFLHQETSDVDVLKVNDGFALQVISTGFDAHVSRQARSRFRKLGRYRYSLIMLLELLKMQEVEYRVEIDSHQTKFKSPLVIVANGNTYGGGMLISPNSKVNDGELEIIFVREVTRVQLLLLFLRIFSGRHIEHPKVTQWTGKRIVLKASTIAESDGESLADSPLDLAITATTLKTWRA